MTKNYLLKPFPLGVHVLIWLLYFMWIGWGNISVYGVDHLKVLLAAAPVMLGIIYLHRFWFRKMFFQRAMRKQNLLFIIAFVLGTCFVLYLLLYTWSTPFTRLILPDPEAHRLWAYLLDIIAFYGSFACKGIGLGLTELVVNLLRLARSTVQQRRIQATTYVKQVELKKWLSHFMGNIAQRIVGLLAEGQQSRKGIEAYLALSSRCVRLMARRDMFVTLSEELYDLKRLASLLGDQPVVLDLPAKTHKHHLVPMMLLGLYKNMCKHGDIGGTAAPAVFTVETTAECLSVHTRNDIAAHAAWLYGEGGTGLDQLKRLLHMYYRERMALHYKVEGRQFQLSLKIRYKDKQIDLA